VVPSLTTTELWKKANQNITERGRGRGKQGRTIQALFRTRIFCPRCGKPMSVLRGKRGEVFYYCRAHYCPWIEDPCRYNRFVPGTWDNEIWDELDVMLKDDVWIEQQLAVELHQDEGLDKQVRLHQLKIRQAEDKIRKVEEGFDGSLYSLEEARKKKLDYQDVIEKEKQEISRLQAQIETQGFSRRDAEALRQELRGLRERNLKEATFEERVDLVAMLGIKIYPSEDLKSRRIVCRLNLKKVVGEREQNDFAKVMFGGPKVYYYDSPNIIQCIGAKMNMWTGQGTFIGVKEVDSGQYDYQQEVDLVAPCTLLKSDVIQRIGFYDDKFFCFLEDSDYCARARRAGYKIAYAPKAKIWHKLGQSAQKITGLIEYYFARNRIWFMKKNATRLQYASFLIYLFVYHLWFMTGMLLYRGKMKQLVAFYRGVRDGLFDSNAGARFYR